jgi:hypothetical protein
MKITIIVEDQTTSQVDVQGPAPVATPATGAIDAGPAPVTPDTGSAAPATGAIDAGAAPVTPDTGSDVVATGSSTSRPSTNGAPISAGPAPTN